MKNFCLLPLIAGALVFCPVRIFAHFLLPSTSDVKTSGEKVSYTLKVPLSDVWSLPFLKNEKPAAQTLYRHKQQFFEYSASRIHVFSENMPCFPYLRHFTVEEPETSLEYSETVGSIRLQLVFDCESRIKNLTIENTLFQELEPRHKNLAKILIKNKLYEFVFEQGKVFETGKVSLASQFFRFLSLGVEHIFTGYDHLLFLFGLLLLAGNFWNLVKIATSFTIAHTATLMLATLGVLNPPSRIVESAIALSIAYVGFENFFIKNADKRWRITFFFGLVHGFGFASILRDLGLPRQGLVLSLLSFNLGVEAGQIVVISILYPFLYLCYKKSWFQRYAVASLSGVVALMGVFWFIQRAFNFGQ